MVPYRRKYNLLNYPLNGTRAIVTLVGVSDTDGAAISWFTRRKTGVSYSKKKYTYAFGLPVCA